MKKILMVLAATVICGACLFTSCKKDEVLNLEEKITGIWITAETDGKALPSNEKIVFDIVSPTEAYVSLSIQDRTAEDTPWRDREEVDVEIDGNDATLIAKRPVTIRQDGCLVRSTENMVRYEKLKVD